MQLQVGRKKAITPPCAGRLLYHVSRKKQAKNRLPKNFFRQPAATGNFSYFFMIFRCAHFTSSTSGITQTASPMATAYSASEMEVNPNAAVRKGT